ncbi:MAG: acyl-CoA/acyl-ACP dehydrogenase [Gaiellaceae bacterium MAG52_C11]|nr:acyl-CoA/acyl-ACP dehydrogenase [Candidatus Gaiellasilicea maunaloa]
MSRTEQAHRYSETEEQQALRGAVADVAAKYGSGYWLEKARANERTIELWAEAGALGYLGANIPEEYGGGGGGIAELAIVCEELAAAGCPLLMIVVSPAIAGTIIARSGTDEQKTAWLPGLAEGTAKLAFAITEPDAGTNSHNLATVARRDNGGWILNGRKTYISGVDESDAVLVVGRTDDEQTGKLRPALFIVPRDTPGFDWKPIEMDVIAPEEQFACFFDDVELPAEALVGGDVAGLDQLFAGLNPERITIAAYANGIARYALEKAVAYANERQVWDVPIGAHQGVSHPLAEAAIQVELARLVTSKAAALHDAGEARAAGEAANMAKLASADAALLTLDRAIQAHGGNGLASEYDLAAYWGVLRVARIAPVSREMILNYVAQHTLGLPRSY